MTYNPKSLQQLGAYWVTHNGVNLGVVGNTAHTKGYHLGKDRIYDGSGPGIGDSDYSVKLARDKAGLTNAASAIDLGRLEGQLTKLYAFSRWLVAEAQQNRTKYRDIREVIYSPDGKVVQRYSGPDNRIYTGPGNGDNSHLTHTHISFFRDSEARDKRPMFAGFFALPPDTATEDAMLLTDPKALTGTVKLLVNRRLWRVKDDSQSDVLPLGTTWDAIGSCTYHQASNDGQGWNGYLVSHKGELYVVPGGVTIAKYIPAKPVSVTYETKLTIGDKPVTTGTVTLP